MTASGHLRPYSARRVGTELHSTFGSEGAPHHSSVYFRALPRAFSTGYFSALASILSDAGRDVYICPNGKTLTTTGRVFGGNTLYYGSSKHDCDACPFKDRCCPKAPSRRIPRDVKEAARDHARALMGTEPFIQSSRRRKEIETRFGDLR